MTLALRKLARRPVFSLTTLLCLALGIGATTGIGSVVNTLFFQSASVENLDRVAFFMAMREGVAACYFPARRAGATNPVDALRME